ncbi:MAG: hypothetical protein SF053_01950 [Bacteroidia bacterium]|nr:hypothetical protein [Bacteroidia bacterium]
MNKMFVVLALLLTGALAAQAQHTPGFRHNQVRQQQRICRGARTGSLTSREYAVLQGQQLHLNRTRRHMKADGRITVRERARLNRMQRRASHHIRHQRHDRQGRF